MELSRTLDSPRVPRYRNGLATDQKVFEAMRGSLGMTVREVADKAGIYIEAVAACIKRNPDKIGEIYTPVGYKSERLVWLK